MDSICGYLHTDQSFTRSLAAAFAPTPSAFIIFVALQGLGAAANTPAGIGLFVANFPPGARRNQAFGVLGAGQPIGFILGTFLAGFIVQSKATWRGIYYVQGGLAMLLSVVSWAAVSKEKSNKRSTKGLDWGGCILSIAGFGLLSYSLASVFFSFVMFIPI
jgi:MFS family permease